MAAALRLHPLGSTDSAAATDVRTHPPSVFMLQAQAHPKLGRQLEYLGKLVRATVQAMATPAPAAH